MTTLLSVMILCCAAEGAPDFAELQKFKETEIWPRSLMMWLEDSKNRDAIDVVGPQYEDLQNLMRKYGRQLAKIKRDVREKYPYRVDPATGRIIGIESPRAHRLYLKAVARASAPVEEAWRKEIRQILTPSQIAKMNEIKWRKSGAALLFDEDFHSVLKLDQQQRVALKKLYEWSITTPENSPGGAAAGDDDPVMVAKEMEAHEKALELLTPEQRKAFDFLLGRQE